MRSKVKNLLSDNGFLKYFKNTSWLVFERFFRLFVGLFIVIWIARYLGPEQFGLYSYVQTFAFFFIVISGLGIDSIVVMELVKEPAKKNEILGSSFILKLFGVLLAFILLAISMIFSTNDTYTNMLIFIIVGSTFFQPFSVIDFFFQAKVINKYIVLSNIFSFTIATIIKIILLANDAPLIFFIWTIVAENMFLAAMLIFFYTHKKNSVLLWKFNKNIAKKILHNSWPLLLNAFILMIYTKIDQIMIQEFLGNIAVGQYAAATRLSEASYMIPIVIANSLFPAVVNAKKVSEELFYLRFKRLYSLIIWFTILLAIITSIFSDFIIKILYGIEYQEAASVLAFHVWVGIFVSINIITLKLLIINNQHKKWLFISFAGTVSLIALNYIFIPKFGILGAVYSSLVAQALTILVLPLVIKIDKNYPKIIFQAVFFLKNYKKREQ